MAKFNPFKKDDWKHAEHDVENKVKDKAGDISHDVGHAAEGFAHDTRGAFTDFGKQVEKGWDKGVESPFKHKIIDGVRHDVIAPSGNFVANVKEEFSKKNIEQKITQHINDASQEALQKLIREGLKTALTVLSIGVPSSMCIQLGPFIIAIEDITHRIETMKKWVDDPPLGRDKIKELILEFAPSSVTISISAELAFLVVSSDSLSVGFDLTFETQDFIDRYDNIMDEFQV